VNPAVGMQGAGHGVRTSATYRRGVLRNALRPRWLALLALVLVVCVAFGWMGSWQLGVARDKGGAEARRQVATSPRVPLEQVLQPQQGFPVVADARRVSVQGRYDAERHVLISGRLQHGTSGWWVVTAVRTSAGAWLPVVRGWVPRPDDPAVAPERVPAGPVRLEGVLQPDDAPADDAPADDAQPAAAAAGTAQVLRALDAAELVNLWGAPIYNGFLVLTAEQAEAGRPSAAQPERVPPPQPQPTGLSWRNAAYAVQWWVFAGFALVLWWKMVRQDAQERAAALPGGRVEDGRTV
jgi:surfeit locus 1 family protein